MSNDFENTCKNKVRVLIRLDKDVLIMIYLSAAASIRGLKAEAKLSELHHLQQFIEVHAFSLIALHGIVSCDWAAEIRKQM